VVLLLVLGGGLLLGLFCEMIMGSRVGRGSSGRASLGGGGVKRRLGSLI